MWSIGEIVFASRNVLQRQFRPSLDTITVQKFTGKASNDYFSTRSNCKSLCPPIVCLKCATTDQSLFVNWKILSQCIRVENEKDGPKLALYNYWGTKTPALFDIKHFKIDVFSQPVETEAKQKAKIRIL